MINGGMMFSKGDIVIINFPFSNILDSKKRPVVVLAEQGEDIICCAITSNPESEGISLDKFESGSLPFKSKIKYWQIHTILKGLAVKKIAKIDKKTHNELIKKIDGLIGN